MRKTILALAALALLPACSGDETTVVNVDLDSLAPGTGVALNGGTLITFSLSAPGTILSSVPVSGTDPAYTLVGIDFRPATKQLYGLAIHSSGTMEYLLYAINP